MGCKGKNFLGVFFFVLICFLFTVPVSTQEIETEESLHLKGFKAAYPTTSVAYRGVVAMDADNAYGIGSARDEIYCDFGSLGLWVCTQIGIWTKLNAVDPDWIIAFQHGGTNYLLADFGTLGLWYWYYNGSWSGAWVKASGSDAEFAFAVDDDGDGSDEVHVDFGSLGLWRYDMGSGTPWTKMNGLSPSSNSFRAAIWSVGPEAGIFDFGSAGIWRVSGAGTIWTKLKSLSPGDDNAAADVTGTASQELIFDFGSTGLWLYDGASWHELAGSEPYDIREVQFATADYELLCAFGGAPGLWMWNYTGYPGTWTKLNGTDPDWDGGFCEPFNSDLDSEEEIAVDFKSVGLWCYDYTTDNWTKMNGVNPEFMVRCDWYNDGSDTALVVDFGPGVGLWLYDGLLNLWMKLSGQSPDGVD